jgi:hypothetical protein
MSTGLDLNIVYSSQVYRRVIETLAGAMNFTT